MLMHRNLHELMAMHAPVPRLIMLDDFGNNVGNALPPEAPEVFHLAADYSDSPTFDGLFRRMPDSDSLVDNPKMGCEFMLLASKRARDVGDFNPAERFVAQAAAFTRQISGEDHVFYSYDVASEKAGLLAQTGRPLKAEKALRSALTQLERVGRNALKSGEEPDSDEHVAAADRLYKGYLTLSALQARQGKFTKAVGAVRGALGVRASDWDMLTSQKALETGLIPGLEALLEERGDKKQGLTPEEEEGLWRPVEEAGDKWPAFRVERPLTEEERERYSYIYDPEYLPTRSEAQEALQHDRILELIHRFYRSGLPGERYEMWTGEYIAALGSVMIDLAAARDDTGEPLRVLEVGAGEARLSAFVARELETRRQDAQVWATDLNPRSVGVGIEVEHLDYRKALEAHRPHIVLNSWMPLGKDWTPAFRASPGLQTYIMVGAPEMCATPGAWKPTPDFGARDLVGVERFRSVEHPYGVERDTPRVTRAVYAFLS